MYRADANIFEPLHSFTFPAAHSLTEKTLNKLNFTSPTASY